MNKFNLALISRRTISFPLSCFSKRFFLVKSQFAGLFIEKLLRRDSLQIANVNFSSSSHHRHRESVASQAHLVVRRKKRAKNELVALIHPQWLGINHVESPTEPRAREFKTFLINLMQIENRKKSFRLFSKRATFHFPTSWMFILMEFFQIKLMTWTSAPHSLCKTPIH